MSDNTSFFIYAPIIIALVSLAGLAGVVLTDNPQVQANKDNIAFLLEQKDNLIEIDKILGEAMMKQTIRTVENADAVTALQDYDIITSKQIGDIRADIKSKFPQASNLPDQGQATGSTTPFLTLKMDKKEFFLGNTIFFMGTAQPNLAIQLTLKSPDRMLIPIAIPTTEIINGAYIANYTLRLDDPIGNWQVYARQQSDQTKTLTFTVE